MMFNNRNVVISPSAIIGKNVKIGDNSIIFDNVTIGDNTIISHNCVIGEPLQSYFYTKEYLNPTTSIGANSLVRSHSIIYAGNKLGDYLITAHKVVIRENCNIGKHCMIGLNVEVHPEVIIGDYSRLYSYASISQGTIIGKYVYIYPNVITTNDPTPPSNEICGSFIDDYTIVCAGTTILPKVKIGKNCLIGANSLVSKSFSDGSFIIGHPAKYMMSIEDFKILNKGKPYPWMKRYSRGMPWEDISYEEWSKENV